MPGTHSVRITPALRSLLDRGAAPVALALAGVAALGWLYLLAGAGMDVPAPATAAKPAPIIWSLEHAATVLAMWVVMMAAMMLPGAAPMLLLHGTIARKRRATGGPAARTGVFAGGYLLAWAGFSLAATGTQWAFQAWGLVDAMMAADSALLGAALLATAGLYQLSPLKYACLRQCRSPLTFLAQNWRDDAAGTLRLGLRHGTYCLGCCWALMALLFVGGVMNMLWIAGLTLFVLVEKVVPRGRAVARISGWALIAAGAFVLTA